MGAGLSGSRSRNNQKATLEEIQSFGASCRFSCDQQQDGTTVNIGGDGNNPVFSGDLTVGQSCEYDTECIINNAFHSTAQSLFDTKSKTDAKNASGFLSFNMDFSDSKNVTEIEQRLRQEITEKCEADEKQYQKNVTVNVKSGEFNGNTFIGQKAGGNVNCVLANLGRASAYSKGSIVSETSSGGMDWMQILIAVAILFTFIGLVFALIYAFNDDKKGKIVEMQDMGMIQSPNKHLTPGLGDNYIITRDPSGALRYTENPSPGMFQHSDSSPGTNNISQRVSELVDLAKRNPELFKMV